MSRKCSGCQHFQKMRHLAGNSGLCLLRDGRVDEDGGCQLWKAIPFDRAADKKRVQSELAQPE